MDAEAAAEIERTLEDTEASVEARSRLLKYAARQNDEASVELRGKQLSWLVRNEPGAEILSSPAALIYTSEGPMQDAAGYVAVKALWLEQVSKNPTDAVVLGHAAWFLELADPEVVERFLTPVVTSVGGAAMWLGKVYGYSAVGLPKSHQNIEDVFMRLRDCLFGCGHC